MGSVGDLSLSWAVWTSIQPQPGLGRQAAPASVRPKGKSGTDSDSILWPGLGQTDNVNTHLNFSRILGGQGGPSPQAAARWRQSGLLPSPWHVLRTGNSFEM